MEPPQQEETGWQRLVGGLLRAAIIAALVVLIALVLFPVKAHAGRSCEQRKPTPALITQGMQLAERTSQALDASGARAVLLARAGQDLGKYGLRWSHLGIAYKTDAGAWRVVHKLNQCGTAVAGLYLGKWKADLMQRRHIDKAGVGNVATADLRRAFKQMTDQNALTHALPVVALPAEVVHQRCQEKRRVRHAPRDHDISARRECGQQRIRAQIGIGRYQPVMQTAHGLIRFQQRRIVRQHPGQHVVTRHDCYAQACQAQLTRDLQHGLASGNGVGRAHVGDKGSALPDARRQYGTHAFLQQQVVALLAVAQVPQLRQRNRAFGQAFEHQRIQLAALGQIPRRVDPVAGITGA